MSGLLITVEGIDGSGTTSVVEAIEERFDSVKTTKEPAEQYWTGRATRKAIQSDNTHPMTDFHFFIGDRAYHIENTIQPALSDNTTVVSDRYYHSTLAYQQEFLRDVVENPLQYIKHSMKDWVIYPDLTILLDVPVDIAAKRTSDGDKYEIPEFLKNVRQNYLDLESSDSSIIKVDASQPKEVVIEKSLTIIEEAMTLEATSSCEVNV